jgi:ABC-type uncharacterized transport system permease subunit
MSEAIGQPGQAALPRPLGIGEILSTAFDLYRRHWRTLLAIAAVVVVPLTLLQYLFGDWLRTRGEVTSLDEVSTATWAVGAAGLVAGLAGLLMYLVLTGRSPGRWPVRTRAWSRATGSASTAWGRSCW